MLSVQKHVDVCSIDSYNSCLPFSLSKQMKTVKVLMFSKGHEKIALPGKMHAPGWYTQFVKCACVLIFKLPLIHNISIHRREDHGLRQFLQLPCLLLALWCPKEGDKTLGLPKRFFTESVPTGEMNVSKAFSDGRE